MLHFPMLFQMDPLDPPDFVPAKRRTVAIAVRQSLYRVISYGFPPVFALGRNAALALGGKAGIVMIAFWQSLYHTSFLDYNRKTVDSHKKFAVSDMGVFIQNAKFQHRVFPDFGILHHH